MTRESPRCVRAGTRCWVVIRFSKLAGLERGPCPVGHNVCMIKAGRRSRGQTIGWGTCRVVMVLVLESGEVQCVVGRRPDGISPGVAVDMSFVPSNTIMTGATLLSFTILVTGLRSRANVHVVQYSGYRCVRYNDLNSISRVGLR
jgi:hypothetical protein